MALSALNELNPSSYLLETAHNTHDYVYALRIVSLSNTMWSKAAATVLLLAAPLKTYIAINFPSWSLTLNRLSTILDITPSSIQDGFSQSAFTLMIHNFLASDVHSQWHTVCHNNQTLCVKVAKQCFKSAFKVAAIGRTEALTGLKEGKANSAANNANYVGFWMGAKFSNCMNIELNKAVGNALLSKLTTSLHLDFFEASGLTKGELKPVIVNEIASGFTHATTEYLLNMNKSLSIFSNCVIKLELKKILSGKMNEMLADFLPIASTAAATAFSDGGPYDMFNFDAIKASQYTVIGAAFLSNRPFELTWRDCVGGFTSSCAVRSLTQSDAGIGNLWSTCTVWRAKFTHHRGSKVGKLAVSGTKNLVIGGMSFLGSSIVGIAFQQYGWMGKIAIWSGSFGLAIAKWWEVPFVAVSMLAIDEIIDNTISPWFKPSLDQELASEALKLITAVSLCAASIHLPILLPVCKSVSFAVMTSSTETFLKMMLDDFTKTFPDLAGTIKEYIDYYGRPL